MEILVKKNIEQDVVDDIICDCCGKSTKTDYGFVQMKLSAHWGFMSKHDLEKWEANVCESCVEEKLSFINFKKGTYYPRP